MMNIGELKFYCKVWNKEITIKEYLISLLRGLWLEKENFSSKRPLGESDWDGEIIICLIENNVISGVIDEEGYIINYDEEQLNKVIVTEVINKF